MKKTIQLLTLLFITIVSFTACENEPLEGFELLTETNSTEVASNNNTTTTTNTGGTPSGDYYPMAVNNEWNYSLVRSGQTQNFTSKIVSTFTNQGETIFKNEQVSLAFGGAQVTTASYVYKNGGNYYTYTDGASFSIAGYDAVQTGIPNYVILVDNKPVGYTWSVAYSQTTSYTPTTVGLPNIPDVVTSLTNDFEIVEKDATITVGTETYSPVIKLKSIVNVTSVSGNTTSEVYFYFAKNVGLVKNEVVNGTLSETLLETYTLF